MSTRRGDSYGMWMLKDIQQAKRYFFSLVSLGLGGTGWISGLTGLIWTFCPIYANTYGLVLF